MPRWVASLGVLLALAAACRAGNAPGNVEVPPPQPSAAALPQSGSTPGPNGLLLRGETRFVGPESDAVEVAVTVTNPGARPVRLRLGPCPLRVQIDMLRGRDPAKWDSERDRSAAEQAACEAGERRLILPPGGSVSPEELRMRIPVRPVAGPAGFFSVNHYFTVTVRLDGDTLRLPPIKMALPKPKYPPPIKTVEGVTFRADSRVIPHPKPHVLTTVTMTNTSQGSVWLRGNWCPVKPRAHRNAARSGRPAWDPWDVERQRAARKQQKKGGFGGGDVVGGAGPEGGPPIILAPGESDSLQERYSMGFILGDSLPEGRYYFTAILELATPPFQSPELPAGSAMLTR